MRLSVGTRWTLRYSLAMLVTVVVLALLVYDRVERRIQQDAELLLDLQVAEVLDALERHDGDRAGFERWLEQKVAIAKPMIGLGIAVLGSDGSRRMAVGALERHPLPMTPEFLAAVERDRFVPVGLGRGSPHFVTAVPLEDEVLQVAIYGRPFERRAGHIGRVFQIAIPVMLVLTLGCGWWLTRRSLHPISEITDSARRITGSHLEEWIATSGTGDELDRLAETLNGMMARIRQGMERSREFQTRLARELRAPVLALQREMAALSDEPGLSDLGRRRVDRALEDAEVLAEAVHAMLRLAWSDVGNAPNAAVDVPLAALVRGAASSVGPAAERRGVTLGIGPLVDASVSGDPFWLRQLFDAVLEAAVANAPSRGSVVVWAEKVEEEATCQVSLRATPPLERGGEEKVESGPGASARLSLAREIARAHGGQLETESRVSETEYRLRLPV